MSDDNAKRNAAIAALDYVENGMVLGLGTGSTAAFFIEFLADDVANGLSIKGVPTSDTTRKHAEKHNIPLLPVDRVERINLCVDGADEIDNQGRMIKGGGGALLREKIIANMADHMMVIADTSKKVERLGDFALPVEVDPFGFTITAGKVFDALKSAGITDPRISLREKNGPGQAFISDGGHYILDCACKDIPDPEQVADYLSVIPGVVEHGLFIDYARTIIFSDDEGVEIFEA